MGDVWGVAVLSVVGFELGIDNGGLRLLESGGEEGLRGKFDVHRDLHAGDKVDPNQSEYER